MKGPVGSVYTKSPGRFWNCSQLSPQVNPFAKAQREARPEKQTDLI